MGGNSYMNIAYLGIPGSFSHQAAEKYFGSTVSFAATATIAGVFAAVAEGTCKAGVVPLENSLHGNVVESFDLMGEYTISIVGEVYVKIRHCLLGKPETEKKNDYRALKRCLSHWQAISQCEQFFTDHPWITPVYVGDTASAAREVTRSVGNTDVAIAGKHAADLYGLTILEDHLEKHRNNYTRFGIISKTPAGTGSKISLSFSVKHTPGSLVAALTPYAKHGLNLMQIESRPKKGSPWEYTFFLDLEIGEKNAEWEAALRTMRRQTSGLKILGRYPKGIMYET